MGKRKELQIAIVDHAKLLEDLCPFQVVEVRRGESLKKSFRGK
jgi:hypothetical protein